MLPFHGKYPKLDPKSCVMPGAELAGDVELKEYASIWQNCALRGDVNKIVVGRYSNVQDNSVLHVDDDKACILGDYVTIGHGAIVHASTIEDNVFSWHGRHCIKWLSYRLWIYYCSRCGSKRKHCHPT